MSCTSADPAPDRVPGPNEFDELWDYADPAATEARFRALLPEVPVGANRDLHAQILTQVARTHSLRGEFAEAHDVLDGVERMLSEETRLARVRYLLERGRSHNSAGEKERAIPLFEEAWELGNAIGAGRHALDAAHMLGIACPPERALEWNLRAIAIAKESADPDVYRWLGPLYNNTGLLHLNAGDFEQALSLYTEGYEWRKDRPNQAKETRIARWCIGHTLRKMGDVEEALSIFRELSKEGEAADDPDGYVFEELAECLEALGRQAEARPHFARAFEELSKDPWFVKNEPQRLARLASRGSGDAD